MTRSPIQHSVWRTGRRALSGRGSAVVRSLLVLLFLSSTTLSALHVHDAPITSDTSDSWSADSSPTGGEPQAESQDCQLCELNRRGETDSAIVIAPLPLILSDSGRADGISDKGTAQSTYHRDSNAPRAPPTHSI